MDNSLLSEAQLSELKAYIQKKGIKEPDVVNEVLDHFACKVEELMSSQPAGSWDKIVHQAHHSFGPTGFRPLIASYEDGVSHDLWRAYKAALKKTLLSPAVLFGLSGGLLTVAAYPWYLTHTPSNTFFDAADYLFLSIVVLWAAIRIPVVYRNYHLKTEPGKLLPFWKKKARSMPDIPMVVILLNGLFFNHQPHHIITPWIYGLLCFAALISLVTQWKLIRYAGNRYGTKIA